MAYLSVVDIKHATSAVDQLTVTGLLRYGQVASLRRLQMAQFRYGAPVFRSLFCNTNPPTHVRIHIAQEQRQKQIEYKKKEEKVKLLHDIVRKLDKNKKRHDEARKKLFLEYTEEMCDEEQSVNGNGRRKRAQGVSLPAAGCNIK
jgi:hypothetical protein